MSSPLPIEPWAAHLDAFVSSMRHEIMAMRLLAKNGISVGDGRRYERLVRVAELEPLLKQFEGILEGLERSLSPGKQTDLEPESATRFALRVRLNLIADDLEQGLDPDQISRAYGSVPPRVADMLMQVLPRLKRLVADAGKLIDQGKKHP